MKRKIISIILCFALVLLFAGCETIPEQHKGAAVGAGVGAATGAVAGAVIGDSARGTVIGGLLGALVGGAIGHYYYDQKKTQQETAQTYNYASTQGTLLTIEGISVSPPTARSGDVVNLGMTYAVLTPDTTTRVTITEIREITHAGALVGRPQVNVERTGGTYTSSVPIKLPADAKKGTYRVTTTIQAAAGKDVKETSFTVQ